MRITAERLRKLGASEFEVEIFEQEWPDWANVTKANVLRAVELELDAFSNLHCLANKVLNREALKAYRKAVAQAEEVYWKTTAPIQEGCEIVIRTTDSNAMKRVVTREAREKALAPAWEAYRKAVALAFWRAVLDMERGGAGNGNE